MTKAVGLLLLLGCLDLMFACNWEEENLLFTSKSRMLDELNEWQVFPTCLKSSIQE
jgi:hypothetical protein